MQRLEDKLTCLTRIRVSKKKKPIVALFEKAYFLPNERSANATDPTSAEL